MKTIFISLTLMLLSIVSLAQSQTKKIINLQQKPISENAIYQLFPTQNYWTFIKLNTRNGKMWQVHFSLQDDINTGELVLNSLSLVNEEKEVNGRFTLYPTENMYNFLLLDQIDGQVIQIQWSLDSNKRGIVSVIKPLE